MKLIFISGPSGSGKTTLSNKIFEKINNGLVLSTDNYYKTGLISKLLSKCVENYYDKIVSFNFKLFKKDFDFIVKNGISINERSYDFKKKKIINSLKETNNINFLIVEGIFARDFSSTLFNQKFLSLELKINKYDCMKRVVHRDLIERGKGKKKASKDFLKSWEVYYKKFKKNSLKKNKNELIITKSTNIDKVINEILSS